MLDSFGFFRILSLNGGPQRVKKGVGGVGRGFKARTAAAEGYPRGAKIKHRDSGLFLCVLVRAVFAVGL